VEARLNATEDLVVQILREAVKENPEIAERMGETDKLRQAINILYQRYKAKPEQPEQGGNPDRWLVQTTRAEQELDRLLQEGYEIVMRLEDGRYKLRKRATRK